MKISKGLQEDGIVVGNTFDKYETKNPLAKWLVERFDSAISGFVDQIEPSSIHEIGCGEGYWSLSWAAKGIDTRGSDFSETVIKLAKENALEKNLDPEIFRQKSIYDLVPEIDSADLIVCCEVLEHIEHPEDGLNALKSIVDNYIILSVPREPIWRILNLMRGKYIRDLGNTPGHIQHWSQTEFLSLIGNYFQIVAVAAPAPWTIALCKKS